VRISATARIVEPGYHCVPGPPFWTCDDARTPHMELGVRIIVPGLIGLPPGPGLYVRCGDTASCTDQDNVLADHPSAFFGDPKLVANVQALAQRFQALYPDLELHVTDMSLPMGGLFDIDASWETPHNRHRNGRSVDVSRNAWNKTTGAIQYLTDTQVQRLTDIAQRQLHMHKIDEGQNGPIHFELLPLVPVDPCHP
jgi:murein endopeptidase